ncbi:protein TBATA isoform X2 [Sphaerodactylus townsendi]|uniref:protein TBATA isoform X2 n=1 Tax=Sphaerodactylus townsendi TaxID=933632 RepID=UPI0020275357|nr:protein TBATA isoform X2 [Sphaerodactylus townsendi]
MEYFPISAHLLCARRERNCNGSLFYDYRHFKMASDMKKSSPHLQQIRAEEAATKEEMEKPKGPIISTFRGKNIAALAGKLKHLALNIPLRFSVQAPGPHSKNTARFGSLSHHSFFSRHNPHPHQVTHIQGLNGALVCKVNDEWCEQVMLPCHPTVKSQFHTSIWRRPGIQTPIGDPQPLPVPRLPIGSLSDAWRDELRELTAKLRAASFTEKKETKPQRKTQYSEETGRLIPPSSRATTHHSSRWVRQNNAKNNNEDSLLSFQDQELIVLELLCQILQTDSLTAIQHWLLTAGQKEKNLVMGLLQIATANLHLEPQELPTVMEERFPSQLSQNGTGFAPRKPGKNHLTRLPVTKQKQEPIPLEEMPVNIGTAEVLQLHSFLDEKQNQEDQPE